MRRIDAETKEKQGTLEKSRELQVESVEFTQVEKLYSPNDWPDEAKIIFQDFCRRVRDAGHLTLGIYTGLRKLAYDEFKRRQAEQKLNDCPTDMKWLKAYDIHGKSVERGLAKFGMYPADLYRVPATKGKETKLSLLK
jgi:hypothetical protein